MLPAKIAIAMIRYLLLKTQYTRRPIPPTGYNKSLNIEASNVTQTLEIEILHQLITDDTQCYATF